MGYVFVLIESLKYYHYYNVAIGRGHIFFLTFA